MTNDVWGILGNPTKAEIDLFKNMPFGAFKEHVAAVKRKAKGKRHEVYKFKIVREIVTRYQGEFKCGGFGYNDAYKNAQAAVVSGTAKDEVFTTWESEPVYTNKEIVRLA